MYWPEVDPRCGPGTYVLQTLKFPVTQAVYAIVTYFVVELYVTANTTDLGVFVQGSRIANATLPASGIGPGVGPFASLSLPTTFVADTITSRFHLITWRPVSAVALLLYAGLSGIHVAEVPHGDEYPAAS